MFSILFVVHASMRSSGFLVGSIFCCFYDLIDGPNAKRTIIDLVSQTKVKGQDEEGGGGALSNFRIVLNTHRSPFINLFFPQGNVFSYHSIQNH